MSEIRVRLEIELTAQAFIAAVPGREAVASEMRELLVPAGHEFVHLELEGHEWAITDVAAVRSSGEV